MSRPGSVAETVQIGFQMGLEHYREFVLLGFRVVSDGQLEQMRKRGFEVLHFFEEETDAGLWEQLKAIPDPETMQPDPVTGEVDPYGVRSLAETWLAQFEGLAGELRGKEAVV